MKYWSFCLSLLVLFTLAFARAEAPLCRSVFKVPDTKKNFFNLESVSQIKTFNKYRELFEGEAQQGSQGVLNEVPFKEIMHKVFISKENLTTEQMTYLISDPRRARLYEGLLYYSAMIEVPAKIVMSISQVLRTRDGNLDFVTAKGAKKKALYLLQSFYNGPLKFILLIPPQIDLPGGQTPTDKIFKKLWKNRDYEPTQLEWGVLADLRATKAFQERKAFLNEHRGWVMARRLTDYVIGALLVSQILQAINWGIQSAEVGSFVPVETFLNDPRYALNDHQVRLFNETVPFPHMAIEIDGLVYSYGQTHMTVRTTREYLLTERIRDVILAEKGEPEPEKGFLEKAIAFVGMDKLERSVQSVTLNLTREDRNQLKRTLEMNTGKRYRNHTLTLDCSSMVVKALSTSTETFVPFIVDPSPSSVLMYLANLKTLRIKNKNNENLVADVVHIQIGKKGISEKAPLLRNLYINMLEGRVMTSFISFSMLQRSYLEVRYSGDLQYWDQETRDYIASWQPQAIEELKATGAGDQIEVFEEAFKQAATAEEKAQVRSVAQVFFEMQLKALDEQNKSMESRFEDIMKSEFKIQWLQQQSTHFN
jgi:hypothetical protein